LEHRDKRFIFIHFSHPQQIVNKSMHEAIRRIKDVSELRERFNNVSEST